MQKYQRPTPANMQRLPPLSDSLPIVETKAILESFFEGWKGACGIWKLARASPAWPTNCASGLGCLRTGHRLIAWSVFLQISQKTTAVHSNIKWPLVPHRLHILVVAVLCVSTAPTLAFTISKFSARTSAAPEADEEPCKTWDARTLSQCTENIPLLCVALPYHSVATPSPVAPARAKVLSLKPPANVEMAAAAGSPAGLVQAEVPVLDVALEIFLFLTLLVN